MSVVTPCHNVNIQLLERTFKSLRDQTCGFGVIEWIVVIHNCVEENALEIENLVKGYENIKTFRLQNDKNYAASPRNYGIDRATGVYIGFLDADDYVELNAFEVVLGYLRETGAQVIVFRYETLRESSDVKLVLRPLMYLDQTRKCIVGSRDSLDGSRILHGEAFQIGSKAYLRSFLNENKIRFNEAIPFAEESEFFIRCYGNAGKVCFLPQFIGQVYCQYSDGMMAMMKKTPETAMNYARGFKILFDSGRSLNLYMNTVIWDMLGYYSAVLLATMDMSYKERKEVKRILWPYVKTLTPLEESKVYTASKIKLMNRLIRTVLGRPGLISAAMSLLRGLKVDMASKMDIQYDTE
jgi:glycosyltransferase involved in cell wall biosynthesis